VSSFRKFDKLRRKLLSGEHLNTGEATGDEVANMLKEIEETCNLGNPYCVATTEVEQRMTELKERMAGIRMIIEAMWKPRNDFKDCTLTAIDMGMVSPAATSISFTGCSSKEWVEID
jgi:hypothetical protein